MEKDYLEKKLEDLLGITLEKKVPAVEPNSNKSEEGFIRLVNILQELLKKENTLKKQTGVDFANMFDPYWEVMEEMVFSGAGEDFANVIWWYLFQAKEDKYITYLRDGSKVKLKTPADLFNFIQNK